MIVKKQQGDYCVNDSSWVISCCTAEEGLAIEPV